MSTENAKNDLTYPGAAGVPGAGKDGGKTARGPIEKRRPAWYNTGKAIIGIQTGNGGKIMKKTWIFALLLGALLCAYCCGAAVSARV